MIKVNTVGGGNAPIDTDAALDAALRQQNGALLEPIEVDTLAASVRGAMEKIAGSLDDVQRVFVSEADHRTAGYGVFVDETDASGHEWVLVYGFDVDGNKRFEDRISI